MKFSLPITSFLSGELSPKILGSSDSKEYRNGAAEMFNMLPGEVTGVFKRPGTYYLHDVEGGTSTMAPIIDTDIPGRLFPLVSTNDKTYLILIRPLQFTAEAGTPTNIFKCIRAWYYDRSTESMTEEDVTIDGTVNLTGLDIKDFSFVQVGDILILTHYSGAMEPLIVANTSAGLVATYFKDSRVFDQFPLIAINDLLKVPYRPQNTDSTHTLTASAVSGAGITITSSKNFFDSGHIGAYIRISDGTTEGVAKVVGYTSATVVTADVKINFGDTAAHSTWRESAWSPYRGYPRTVTYFEQRLIFGSTLFDTDTVFCSVLGNLFWFMGKRLLQDEGSATDVSGLNFFGDAADTDAFSFYPGSARVNKISWLGSRRTLNVGTLGGEYIVQGADGAPLTPTTVNSRLQTSHGGKEVQAVSVDDSIMFTSRNGKRVREFRYSDENGSYLALDNSALADHIYNHMEDNEETTEVRGFKHIVWQESQSILWGITSHGALVGFSRETSTGLRGWHRHSVGGIVHSVAVATYPNADELFLFVEREINSVTQYYIERLTLPFDRDAFEPVNDWDDYPICMDSSVVAANPSGTTYRAAHLALEEVRVLADGTDLGNYTLDASGDVDLGANYTTVIMGLEYTYRLKLMPPEAGSQIGSAQISPLTIERVLLRLYRSLGGKFGSDVNSLYDIEYANMKERVTGEWAKTGDVNTEFEDKSYYEDKSVVVEGTNAYPMNILMIVFRGQTQD